MTTDTTSVQRAAITRFFQALQVLRPLGTLTLDFEISGGTTMADAKALAISKGYTVTEVDQAEADATGSVAPVAKDLTPTKFLDDLQAAGVSRAILAEIEAKFTSGQFRGDPLIQAARLALNKGVDRKVLGKVLGKTAGGREVFTAITRSTPEATASEIGGIPIQGAQISFEGGVLGAGSLRVGNISGVGLLQLAMSTDEAERQFDLTEGQTLDVSYQEPETGKLATATVQVFFSDSDPTAIATAAQEQGIVPPDTPEAGTDNETLLQQTMAELGITGAGGDYLGVYDGTPIEIKDPNAPGGKRLVAPVFTTRDPELMFSGWDPNRILDLQMDIEAAGLAPPGSASGVWDSSWWAPMSYLMGYSNRNGLVDNPDTPFNEGYGKMKGIRAALDTYRSGPRRQVPAFVAPTRLDPDPAQMEEAVNDWARQKIGRDLNPNDLADFAGYLADQYEAKFDMETLAAEADYIREQVAAGALPSQAQQQILDQTTGAVVSVDPVSRFQQYFDEKMAGAIGLQGRREQQVKLRDTMLGTALMARSEA